MDLESIAREYFSRMRAGDHGVLDLFADDAVLLGLGKRTEGIDAIREFYSDAIGAGPKPGEPVTLMVEGSRVVAEVYVELANQTVHAIDLFEIEAGKIRSLTYFIADHP